MLKGVNLTLHSGEVMAILGSKGSGKRALLDVIARRADGRGNIFMLKFFNGFFMEIINFRSRLGSTQWSAINKKSISTTLRICHSSK